ncbi:hypothetical protein MRX96_055112 [Rhipicephalus microplus]
MRCSEAYPAHQRSGSKAKPLAYFVPAIIHVLHQSVLFPDYGTSVLVLTGTREVALQVRHFAEALMAGPGIRVLYLLPGDPREQQLKQLNESAHICVATPGRLLSLMEASKINLSHCRFLVLDEADPCLTMGFAEELCTIAGNTRSDRRTFVRLSSRTMDANQLIEEFTNDCITVTIGPQLRGAIYCLC